MTTSSSAFDLSPVRHDHAGFEPHLWQFAQWKKAPSRTVRPDCAAEQLWEGEGGAVVGSKPQRARR